MVLQNPGTAYVSIPTASTASPQYTWIRTLSTAKGPGTTAYIPAHTHTQAHTDRHKHAQHTGGSLAASSCWISTSEGARKALACEPWVAAPPHAGLGAALCAAVDWAAAAAAASAARCCASWWVGWWVASRERENS